MKKKIKIVNKQFGGPNKPVFVQKDTFANSSQQDAGIDELSYLLPGYAQGWSQESTEGQKFVNMAKQKGYDVSYDNDKITLTKGTGVYKNNPWVDRANAAAVGLTSIGNIIQNNKLRKSEEDQLLESINPAYMESDQGVNDIPTYTKAGGKGKYPYGGGPLTAEGAKEILSDGTVHGKKLTDKQKRYFGYIAGGGKVKQTGGDSTTAKKYADLPYLERLNTTTEFNYYSEALKKALREKNPQAYDDFINSAGESLKKLSDNSQQSIQSNIENLAKNKNFNLYLSDAEIQKSLSGVKPLRGDNSYKRFSEIQDLMQAYKYGIAPNYGSSFKVGNDTSRQFNMYDIYNGFPSSFGSNNGQYYRPTVKDGSLEVTTNVGTAKSTMRKGGKACQTGGDIPETYGLQDGLEDMANVEAEQGEVFQRNDGNIEKVSDQADTHEQGGVNLSNVNRVLEDTSDKRKDKASKLLLMSPAEIEAMFGFKPSYPMSHSKAYEKALEYYGKQRKNIKKNQKEINSKPRVDKVASNSAKLNFISEEHIPTEDDIFDALYAHQEYVKKINNIEDDGTMKNGGWIQDAINPAHKGYCTPMTKKTCTPRRKALAIRFKSGDLHKGQAGAQLSGEAGAVVGRDNFIPGGYASGQIGNDATRVITLPGVNVSAPRKKARIVIDPVTGQKTLVPLNNVLPNNQTLNPGGDNTTQYSNLNTDVNVNPNFSNQSNNSFYEPTYWDELAPSVLGLADSFVRDPELYNPVEYSKIHSNKLDPTAALLANQSDYNAAIKGLSIYNAATPGNIANLAAGKYNANNQIASQFANQNAIIANQEEMYNAGVSDKQSVADANTRNTYFTKVQQSKENQRQQRLQSIADISRVIQLKRRQNASGNLLLKLTPAFNQKGEYNGYDPNFYLPPELGFGDQLPLPVNKPGNVQTDETTKYKIGDREIKRRVRRRS